MGKYKGELLPTPELPNMDFLITNTELQRGTEGQTERKLPSAGFLP